MRRPLQMVLLVLSGVGLLHIALFTDLYLRYVKEGMRPLLIASGALLIVLGVADAVSSVRRRDGDEHAGHGDDGHGHPDSGAPRIAWLLFLPALSLLVYAPPALGAYTASREPAKAVAPQDDFDPLPATSPLPITLSEFTSRVQQDRSRTIKGRTVRMTGFVTSAEQGDSWFLTRIMISCCAADAQSVKVRIHGTPAPSANTWVAVTGTWHPGGTLGTSSASAALDARSVQKVAKPANSYTDALPLTLTR
ncbi:TIGR03943 family putative permease subunit [Streptomyces turgidiscabies]|uniref:Repeat protein (TIGR03943 family) n=1 Tax=Streptomyces turgidiscabies TaxID=85558 RepID=A0ABU0RYX5_9ACTN|nr:TIGR03943 family protein [Streptomyces turgidiscabies]MDQ0937162.1 putative repeat protein (TIGR03943 family) [Streptomyces turgidiscabies]